MDIAAILKKYDSEDSPKRVQMSYRIVKVDDDEQIVTGVVYSPWILDSHGHYMSDKEVEKMAHAFLTAGRQDQVDVMHDNKVINAAIVESYVDREGSDEVPAGSWIATTKIQDKVTWNRIKKGDLNGYSMEVWSRWVHHKATITYHSWVMGETQPDPFDGHTHMFLVKMDENGDIAQGFTSAAGPDNHRHTISRLSVTDPYEDATHRYII